MNIPKEYSYTIWKDTIETDDPEVNIRDALIEVCKRVRKIAKLANEKGILSRHAKNANAKEVQGMITELNSIRIEDLEDYNQPAEEKIDLFADGLTYWEQEWAVHLADTKSEGSLVRKIMDWMDETGLSQDLPDVDAKYDIAKNVYLTAFYNKIRKISGDRLQHSKLGYMGMISPQETQKEPEDELDLLSMNNPFANL